MPFTDREAERAAAYNRDHAAAVGWIESYPGIARRLGIGRGSPVLAKAFARAIHNWQGSDKSLTADGKLGPSSWAALKPEIDASTAEADYPRPPWLRFRYHRSPKIQPVPDIGFNGPEWFKVAQIEEWLWMGPFGTPTDEAETDWDERYFACAPRWGQVTHSLGQIRQRDNTDWCAAFVNYCLHRAGFSHTGSAGANSFVRADGDLWRFTALEEPRQGCVIVLGDRHTGRGSHVGFLDTSVGLPDNPGGHVQNTGSRHVTLLGGNQGGSVRRRTYHNRDLLAATGSNGNRSPYLWPERGTPAGASRCNISMVVPTAREHYCYPTNNPSY